MTRVEMLWEQADPHAVLRDRFGFTDTAAAEQWVAGVLRDRYGIRAGGCDRIVMSAGNALAWTASELGPLVVKWSVVPEGFAQLASLARLTVWLAERDIPVSQPVPASDGRVQVVVDGVSLGVQRVVEGDLLDVHDLDAVRRTGAALAGLHLALAEHPAAAATPVEPLLAQLDAWLASAPSHLPREAVDALRDAAARLPTDDPAAQLGHGDVRSANVLVRDGEVVALLDLEESRVEHAIGELTRSATLLGTRYHDWGPVDDRVHEALRAGYESARPLSPAESAWWAPLLLWWTLRFVPAGDDPTGWREAALARTASLRDPS